MAASTLSLEKAARQHWPIVIVGAGPAGALAARELARLGQQVLLIDKAVFPRRKVCGCCLNGSALAILQSVGLAQLPKQHGAVDLQRLQLTIADHEVCLNLTGLALSREALDAALVAAAVEAGASFLEGTTVTRAECKPGERQLTLRSASSASLPGGPEGEMHISGIL